MKKLLLLSFIAIMSVGAACAQNVQNENRPVNGAKIAFAKVEHNYGTIKQGGDGKCQFEFENTGNEPLILSNVRASCGCTTPSYTKEPIMPGKKGVIDVTYNTNAMGGFTKTVTVISNAVDNPRIILKIKGNVVK